MGSRGGGVAWCIHVLRAAAGHDARLRGAAGDLRAGQERPGPWPHCCDLLRDAARGSGVRCHRRPRIGPDEEPDYRLRCHAAWAPGDLVHGVPHRLLHHTAAEPVLRLRRRLLPLSALQHRPGDGSGHGVLREPGGGGALPDDPAARVAALALSPRARRAPPGSLSFVLTLVVGALLVVANVLASKAAQALDRTRV